MIMSGGSRGIGLAIGVAAARLGANVVLLAKTDRPDPRLPGKLRFARQALGASRQGHGDDVGAVVGAAREQCPSTIGS